MSDTTNKIWYAEYLRFDGSFAPCVVYGCKPTGVRVDGSRYVVQNVREIKPSLARLRLQELHTYFNGVSDVAFFKSTRKPDIANCNQRVERPLARTHS